MSAYVTKKDHDDAIQGVKNDANIAIQGVKNDANIAIPGVKNDANIAIQGVKNDAAELKADFKASQTVDWKDVTATVVSCVGAVVAFACSLRHEDKDVAYYGCATGAGVGVVAGAYSAGAIIQKRNAKVHTH